MSHVRVLQEPRPSLDLPADAPGRGGPDPARQAAVSPRSATGLAEAVFDEIENLAGGRRVLLAFDFDPASEGELGADGHRASCCHCCEKKLKMYFMALWPVGPQMIDDTIKKVIKPDFPDLVVRRGLRQPRLQVRQRGRDQGHRHRPPAALHHRRHGHVARRHPDDAGHHEHPGHGPDRATCRPATRARRSGCSTR